jgi:hypothetical protein
VLISSVDSVDILDKQTWWFVCWKLLNLLSIMEWNLLTAFCPPGEISQSGLVPCLRCPPGYIQALEGQKLCYNEDGEHIGVECLSLPCLNGGSCHSLGPGFFTCECSPGFVGRIKLLLLQVDRQFTMNHTNAEFHIITALYTKWNDPTIIHIVF